MGYAARPALVGNRWVLVGGVVYLLEWVAIIGTAMVGAGENTGGGASVGELLESYLGHVDAIAFMAGWLTLVLVGRVLVFVGLRTALVESGAGRHPLMDLAVLAAAISVALEMATFGLAATAADLADADDPSAMVVLDRASEWMFATVGGGLAVAILCAVWCMWRSGLFSTALNVVGAVSGAGLVVAQLSMAPSLEPVYVVAGFAPLLFWIWMIWAGVVLWRRTPKAQPVEAAR